MWEHDRDAEVEAKRITGPDGQCLKLIRLEPGVWKTVPAHDESQHPLGLVVFYVDDGLLFGPPELTAALAKSFMESWTLKVQGMLECRDFKDQDVYTFENIKVPVRRELTFLGCKLRRCGASVFIHQTHWLEAELLKRGFLHLKPSGSLPEVPEGTILPAEHTPQYKDDLKAAQGHIGSLMWLALKTRPDVAAVTGSIACMATLNPVLATRLAVGVWRYLLHTKDFGLFYEATNNGMRDPLNAFGDASLGVGASRSRTGALVTWGKHVISWKSTRQSITAWSAFEAEADAGASALEVGLRIRGTLEALIGARPETTLFGDNAACLANLLRGHHDYQATRTRHFGLRCSWIRDQATTEGVAIRYMSGTEIPADPLTKTLGRKALEQGRAKLCITAPPA